jgi:hypothetical protein
MIVSTSENHLPEAQTACQLICRWDNERAKCHEAIDQSYILGVSLFSVLLPPICQRALWNFASEHCQNELRIFFVGISFYLDSRSNPMMV